MPPKKAHAKAATAKKPKKQKKKEQEEENQDTQEEQQSELPDPETENEERQEARQKRKSPPADSEPSEPTTKAPKTESNTSNTHKIITFLLSLAALDLCHNPTADPKTDAPHPKNYYSSDLTPFEHLVCGLILNRPLSHNLGQRTIATVLNEPWGWNNAQKVLDDGKENEDGDTNPDGSVKTERVHAMEDAKTQHRQKTAAQLGGLCEVIVDERWDPDSDGSMKGLLEVVRDGDMKGNMRKVLKEKVKGFGDTGVNIFLRRVQGCEGWEGIGWFVDPRTKESLEEVGLPGDGEEVRKLIGEMGEKDVRRCFQIVSERALGIGLEGKVAEMKDMLK